MLRRLPGDQQKFQLPILKLFGAYGVPDCNFAMSHGLLVLEIHGNNEMYCKALGCFFASGMDIWTTAGNAGTQYATSW